MWKKNPNKTSQLKPSLQNEVFLGEKNPHWAEGAAQEFPKIPNSTSVPQTPLLSPFPHPSCNESIPATSISMDTPLPSQPFPTSTWPEQIRSTHISQLLTSTIPNFFTGSTGKFGTAKNCPCAGHCRDWIAGKIFSWKRQDAQGITSLMKFNSWHFVISIFCRILQLPEQKIPRAPQKFWFFLINLMVFMLFIW